MNAISSIALTGMNAAQAQLGASAHNIANAQTPGFRRHEVDLSADPAGGVAVSARQTSGAGASLERDVVGQLTAKNAFMANLAVFKTADATMGALLSIRS